MVLAAWEVLLAYSDAAWQGAFILVGSNEQLGVPLLVLMLLAMLTYCSWRFWECYAGQGSDAANSNFRNFFRYRWAPCTQPSGQP